MRAGVCVGLQHLWAAGPGGLPEQARSLRHRRLVGDAGRRPRRRRGAQRGPDSQRLHVHLGRERQGPAGPAQKGGDRRTGASRKCPARSPGKPHRALHCDLLLLHHLLVVPALLYTLSKTAQVEDDEIGACKCGRSWEHKGAVHWSVSALSGSLKISGCADAAHSQRAAAGQAEGQPALPERHDGHGHPHRQGGAGAVGDGQRGR